MMNAMAYEERWAKEGSPSLQPTTTLYSICMPTTRPENFLRAKLRRVDDPSLLEKLVPTMPIGCKTVCGHQLLRNTTKHVP